MPVRDTDNPKLKRQLQVKKAAKILRQHGLKTAFVLALGGGGGFVNHHYINADEHFIEAMQAQDTDDMRHYADNLVIKNDVNTVMEHIVQEGNIEALQIVFAAAEDKYVSIRGGHYPMEIMGGARERLFNNVVADNIDDYITNAIQNGHYEFLSALAEELGQKSMQNEIFIRLLNEGQEEAAAEFIAHNEEFGARELARLLPELKSSIANQDQINSFLADHFDIILSGPVSSFENLGYGLSDSLWEHENGVRPIVPASRKNNFFRDLLENGYEQAAELILNGPHVNEDLHSLYVQHIAADGDLDRMIESAINAQITTDERLTNFATEAALAGHYAVAERFVDHFELAEDPYRNALFTRSIPIENQDAAHYALLTFIGLGQEEHALDLLESITPEQPDFAYDLVTSLHYMFDPRHRDRLIGMFSGTLDDNLRQLFEEGNRASPSAGEQAPPRVTRPAFNLP